MENVENEGLSFSEILNVIWKRKILVGIVTLCTIIVLVLVVLLWYNPKNVTYKAEFELSFPGSDTNTYPNGEIFNYKDIVTLDKLQRVKQSDEKYEGIDVEKLFGENSIYISKVNEPTLENPSIVPSYQLTIEKSGIDDIGMMVDFTRSLIDLTISDIKSSSEKLAVSPYLASLTPENIQIYSDYLKNLNSECELIIDRYEELIELYSESYMVDNSTLRTHYTNARNAISVSSVQALLVDAEEACYVVNEAALETYAETAKDRATQLLRSKQNNDLIIAQYNSMTGGGVTFISTQMDKIAKENAEIIIELQSLIRNYDPSLSYSHLETTDIIPASIPSDSSYHTKVVAAYNQILNVSHVLDENIKTVYANSIVLNYDSNRIVLQSGKINLLIIVAGGVVLGLILGGVFAVGVDVSKKKKSKKQIEA